MSDSTMTTGLVSTWVSTVDSRGRTHLETRWIDAGAPAPVLSSAGSALAAAPTARPLASRTGHAA
jgi:hypothetical protein